MPQFSSNLQSYVKLPAAKNNSPKIFSPASLHSLTQISQIPQFCTPGVKSHRGFTHPCSLRITQISQIPRFCTPGVKSHRCTPHPCSLRLTQISQIPLIFLMALNLTELGRKVVWHVRVLRVLRFPKLTQIQRDSTKIICANLC